LSEQSAEGGARGRTLGTRFWLGLTLSGITLYLVFRKIDWHGFLDAVRSIKLEWILAGVLIFILSLGVRALLWKRLLTPVAGREARFSDCFAYLMIGYAANNVLPLRLGEVIRAYYISRQEKLGFSSVIAVAAVVRLFDLLGLLCFVVVLTIFTPIPQAIRTGMVIIEIAALAALVVFIVLAFLNTEFGKAKRLLSKFLPGKLVERIFTVISRFAEGLRSLCSVKAIATVLVLSILAWCLVILDAYMHMRAFDFGLPMLAAVFVVTVANLGGILPTSPGAVGIQHYLFVISLDVWGIEREPAVAFAVVRHGVLYTLTTLTGLSCLWSRHFSLRALAEETRRATRDTTSS
jgi:uncharacterized protein (TIRG00374 family)